MAVRVLHLELTDGIRDVYLGGDYSGFVALVTFRGTPLGDISMTSNKGVIRYEDILDRITARFCGRLVKVWLEQDASRNGDAGRGLDAPPVDVIICTCDRSDDLDRCLASMSRTEYPRKSVIVVDNGKDPEDTYKVVKKHGSRYVREKKRGLDFARNAGLAVAEAEFVAFADDDVIVDRFWLYSIMRAFRSDETVACVTGLTMPLEMETEAQQLFEGYSDGGLRRGYERRVFDRLNLPPAAAGKCGAGANMAFRMSALRQVGWFDEALDCGTPAKAGGDTDMYYRLLRAGHKICYEPKAISWHRHRRSMEELTNQLGGYSLAVYAYLTKCLIEYGDTDALKVGLSWFRNHHVRNLVRHVLGRGTMPGRIVWSEFVNVFRGPRAYLRSKAYVSEIRSTLGTERRGWSSRNGFRRTRTRGAERGAQVVPASARDRGE